MKPVMDRGQVPDGARRRVGRAERPHGGSGALRAVLRDGSEVEIRRVRPDDAPRLARAFERLSDESRRLRFMAPKPTLSDAELRYLTTVDGHHHEALGAYDPVTGEGLAVARFVRLPSEPDVAEVAVTVIDEWQHRGLGTVLLERLAERARAQGIAHFSALIASENLAMLELLRRAGGRVESITSSAGVAEYRTELPASGLGLDLRQALRSAAEGSLRLPQRLGSLLGELLRPR